MEQIEEKIPEYWKNLSIENIHYLNQEGIECVEEWRDVKGYEGQYQVSNCGRLKGLKRLSHPNKKGSTRLIREKIKPSFDDGKGYRRVEISKMGVNKKYHVHRLVGIAFIDNPENKPQINHLFGNKSDNRYFNLEWATKSEDRKHAIKVLNAGTGKPWKNCRPQDHPMYGKRGELSPNWGKRGRLHHQFGKKYGECKTSIPIVCNETGEIFEGITHAASILNVREGLISEILKGFDKTINGLTFRYKNHVRKTSKKAIRIVCTNTGEVFDSITDAAVKLNLSVSKISLVLNGIRTHTGGYKFMKHG